jgi:hypothetical protein
MKPTQDANNSTDKKKDLTDDIWIDFLFLKSIQYKFK